MLHATIAPSMADPPPDLPSTVPAGSLLQIPSFITSEEALGVLNFLDGDDGNSWQYEGFERRRRVRRFARPAGSSEGSEEGSGQGSGQGDRDGFGALLDAIAHRVARQISAHDGQEEALCPPPPHLPTQIVAEERPQSSFGGVDPINHWSKPKLRRNSASVNPMPNVTVTAFESEDVCGCGRSSDQAENQYPLCGCYVAQLALGLPAVQRINMPAVRDLECWELASSEHYARIPMPTNSLTVKRGEVLNGWRGRVDVPLPAPGSGGEDGRSVVLTFRCIRDPIADDGANSSNTSTSFPIYDPARTARTTAAIDLPPLSDLLTIIVTTSPIKSNPSTELLERTFDTFLHAGADFAYECRKVIVCDGCRVLDDGGGGDEEKKDSEQEVGSERARKKDRKVSRKHNNTKQALRNGIATHTQLEAYQGFKENLRRLCAKANDPDAEKTDTPTPFRHAEVVSLPERHGYGFALRHALRNCVETPYVCVIQHDRTFMRPTPLREVVHCMANDDRINYVGLSMRSNLMYRDIFLSKYGRKAHEELESMLRHPPELLLDPTVYGPGGAHADTGNISTADRLRIDRYFKSNQHRSFMEHRPEEGGGSVRHQLTLTPTLFWYDNTHVVNTEHYRDFVFNKRFKMVARGGFVEDKLSPVIIRNVERLGLVKGHARFGSYLLDDHSGHFFTGHLDGGSFLTRAEKAQFTTKKG